MSIRIHDYTMILEIDGKVIATAAERACGWWEVDYATGADPLHLALVFNIGHTNAMAYTNAARNLLGGPVEPFARIAPDPQPVPRRMRHKLWIPDEQRRIMATKTLRARGIVLIIIAAAVAGCGTAASGANPGMPVSYRAPGKTAGLSQTGMPRPQAPRGTPTGRGYRAAFAAAVAGSIKSDPQRLAVFSAWDGRLLRWLVRRAPDPVPLSVSPNGRWLYYYNQGASARGGCPSTGFVDPVLWKVPVGGGRPRQADVRTPSIAFSPDGRMVAYTASADCGRVVRIVVRNRRTGATRRIVLARNDLTGQPTFTAQLSWAPDDTHLAVAVAPAAAINVLSVINALHATNAITARPIPPCAGGNSSCLDPAFDIRGRLTFLKWQATPTTASITEWVIRWQRGQAKELFRLSAAQSPGTASASIAVSATGNAVLLEGGTRYPRIWRWYHGTLSLILRSTSRRVAWRPLWLSE
jgi:hypothetical protein